MLIILNIPFAMIGGIVALVVGHFNLSVSASVGFIALCGVAGLPLAAVVIGGLISSTLPTLYKVFERKSRPAPHPLPDPPATTEVQEHESDSTHN